MNDQAAQCRAALAGGTHRGKRDAAQGELEIGRGADDRGVVSAELEQAAAKPCGNARTDLLAHSGGASGGNERHERMVDQRLAFLARADHNRRETIRQAAEAFRGTLEKRLSGERGERSFFGRLPDAGIAADEG